MFIPIDEIKTTSRVWVYQSNRVMTGHEKTVISKRLHEFTNTWAAHGQPLSASFEVRYDHFLILSVDESSHGASGCSIDSSTHIIKELGTELKIDFFNRSNFAILSNEEIELYPINKIKSLILDGTVDETSITFNNLVEDVEAYKNRWTLPIKESWLNRFTGVSERTS